ncbi:MAG: hypothetical protein V1866_02955 [archaeon]
MDGVVGIYYLGKNRAGASNIVHMGADATSAVQNRGNASAGIAVGNGSGLYVHGGIGGVGDILTQNMITNFQGLHPLAFIGNVGYTKNQHPSPENTEPIRIKPKGNSSLEMMITMDGYLWKEGDLKKELEPDYRFGTRNKTEVVGALLHKYFSECGINFEAGKKLVDKLHGRATFSLCALVYDGKETRMITLNDDRAFEPFSYGVVDDHFVVSSESCSIRRLGGFPTREFSGAEMSICSFSNGFEIKRLKAIPLLRDSFQATYYGGPDSLFDRMMIFDKRRALGRANVDHYGSSEATIVIPNPDSGWGVSLGVYEGIIALLEEDALDFSGYNEGGDTIKVVNRGAFERLRKMESVWPALTKKSQAIRTFQQGEPSVRAAAVSRKFGAIDSLLRDQTVACGDDSIVKGSVSEGGSLWMLFNSGIEKLEFWISYGPMIFPSFKEWHRGPECLHELAAQRAFADSAPYGKSVEEMNEAVSKMIAKKLGVDNDRVIVRYNPPDVVKKVIGPDCSYQALEADYPIAEKFWPDWLKREVAKFGAAKK